MGKELLDFGLQMAGNAAGAGMGLLLGGINDRRQREQQEHLQNLQIKGQKEMTDYQYAKQLQMWHDTNFNAQKAELKKAGLNPGLLYGTSGGGATTTGSGGGNVTGANAPVGGGEVQAMIGMGIQSALLRAQKENIEANTEKTKAETEKTSGVDTQEAQTRILDLTQGIENKKAQEILTKVQTRIGEVDAKIKEMSAQDSIDYIAWQTGKALEEMAQAENETFIQRATMNDKIDTVKAEMLGAFLKNALTKSQTSKTHSDIKVNNQQMINMATKIVQDWRSLEMQGQNANTQEAQQKQNAWVNDISESTKLPIEIVKKAVDAIILKNVILK